jgi:hypothetical protein
VFESGWEVSNPLLHIVHVKYSECLPILWTPLAERASSPAGAHAAAGGVSIPYVPNTFGAPSV